MNDIKKICNATNLKYLAMYLCFLDYIHQMFEGMGMPLWLTMLGRLVFPIFLFLAADSFHYTHDRLAYLRCLLYMSWFMTIGNPIIGNVFHNGNVGLMNNAFSTFFITGIFICSWDLLNVETVESQFQTPHLFKILHHAFLLSFIIASDLYYH